MVAVDIFLVCTESSGDQLGACLLAELKISNPELLVHGVGGQKLIDQGMLTTFKVTDFNVMGLVEILSQLKRLKSMFNQLVAQVALDVPKMVLLIDAPDFNLRFAKAVRALNLLIPIVYYVSPQVWAWRKKRVRHIAALVNHMMVLFSFEKDIYQKHGLATTWVGHPLVDELSDKVTEPDFFLSHGLDPKKPLVALAPGSRMQEVKRLLPVMVLVAAARQERLQFAIPLANTIPLGEVLTLLGGAKIPIFPGEMRSIMHHAQAAIVASGTATLETGLLQTPMLVGYKMSAPSFFLASRLVKVQHIALVNIVLGKRAVPELIQNEFCLEKLLPLLDDIVTVGTRRAQILDDLARLKETLGGGGAATRAAAVVASYLH